MKKILVTGCAGFIGSNLVDQLLINGYYVGGVDNFNDYYDPGIKEKNIASAKRSRRFRFYKVDILDERKLADIFKREKPNQVVHLAARAGVRPSIENPNLYARVNVLGTVNLLKLAVDYNIDKFIFGSSSSVYGQSEKLPFSESALCQSVVSPYGASKRAAEFFVESFYHTFGLKSVILRLFTVYGERGRPDMSPALFARAILSGQSLQQFGDGSSSRDYTYVGDIINGIILAIISDLSYEVINLGNSHPVSLLDFISELEKIIGKKAMIEKLPKQDGDVDKTWANIVKARKLLGWEARVSIAKGLRKYIGWLIKKG